MYSKQEIEAAQEAANRYTHASKFWSTEKGQKAILIANALGLECQSTNAYRATEHAELISNERRGWTE